MARCIQSNNVWYRGHLQPAWLVVEDGKIVQIGEGTRKRADADYGDLLVLPGFIDAHTHGNNGVSTETADEREMERWQREIAAEGVTSFAATTASFPFEENVAIFGRLASCVGRDEGDVPGAEVLGIYVEGNFIDPDHRGAQDIEAIVEPSIEVLQRYIEASRGTIIRMVLAIEHDRDLAVLDYAHSQGIGVSVGHSAATYAEVLDACCHGLDGVTHTYNGMSPMHHREPGIVGAALDIRQLYAEIIADGHHVSWPAVRLLGRMKGIDRLVLVSDASPLKGFDGALPSGIHIDEEGQFRTDSGALASSSMRMCDGVRNLMLRAGLPFADAVCAATINPARLLGCEARKGSLEVGKDADIVVLDHAFNVVQTLCRGGAMLIE